MSAIALAFGSTGIAGGSEAAAKKPPKHWDERVLPFVDFVEEERGLDFDHPVRVRFLSEKKFKAELRDDSEPTEDEQEFADQIAGELLALGLVGEEVDLNQASEDLEVADTVGFYDSKREELVVRGTDVESVDARVTIVHELTHALQDQHFDLDKLYDRAKEGSEALALDFLVEGDATTIENAYLDTLSKEEQDEYFSVEEEITQDEGLPEGVPYALDLFSAAPYVLGPPYVYALDPEGGTEGRDRAFRRPPKTEEVLIDPAALAQRQRAEKVPGPKLEQGEKKAYDPEQFGVLTLYLILATRVGPRVALEAVTGWGGDRYLGFQEDGRSCVRVNITGDTGTDTDELESALAAWRDKMPAGAVDVEREGKIVTFTACEAEGVTEPSVETFDTAFYNVLGGRIYVVLDLVTNVDVPIGSALCIGDLVSTDPEVIDLFNRTLAEERDPTDEELAVLDDAYSAAFPACGVPLPE